MADWHLQNIWTGVYPEKSTLALLPRGRLPRGNTESAPPENSDKTIAFFKHIKVEWLAGETPESKPILPHRYVKVGRKMLFDIAGKNQLLISTFPDVPLLLVPQDRNYRFHVPRLYNF